jgi:hypothetical protein
MLITQVGNAIWHTYIIYKYRYSNKTIDRQTNYNDHSYDRAIAQYRPRIYILPKTHFYMFALNNMHT